MPAKSKRFLHPKKVGVLLSGGLDSVALTGHFLKKGYSVWPVYISCGLPWEKIEIYWTKRFLRKLKSKRLKPLAQINLSLEDAYKNNWSHTGKIPTKSSADHAVFLPARNLLLITKALLYLSSRGIFKLSLATLKGNPFQDGRPSYFKLLNKTLSQSFKKPILIQTPFRSLTKKQIIQRARHFPLHLSISCINPKGRNHCGRCNKCAERQKAFRRAGMFDQTTYMN